MRRELFTVPSMTGFIVAIVSLAAGRSIVSLLPTHPRLIGIGASFWPEFIGHLGWSLLLCLLILTAQEIRTSRSFLASLGIGLLLGVFSLSSNEVSPEPYWLVALLLVPPVLASVSVFCGIKIGYRKHR